MWIDLASNDYPVCFTVGIHCIKTQREKPLIPSQMQDILSLKIVPSHTKLFDISIICGFPHTQPKLLGYYILRGFKKLRRSPFTSLRIPCFGLGCVSHIDGRINHNQQQPQICTHLIGISFRLEPKAESNKSLGKLTVAKRFTVKQSNGRLRS